jgi:squalene-associated FAD-dependent desaturase
MLKRTKFRVDAHKTVENLLTEHRQPQNLIDHLWHPLTISALNTPLSTASAQVFANVLRDSLASTREASDLLLPRVDLTALFPAPAAAWISGHGGAVRTAARVKQIDIADHRYRAFFESDSEMFDAIIFAVGPQQLEGLMADVAAPALAYEPIVTIYFKFDSPIRMCEPMSGQVGGLAQWYFDRRALSDTPGSPPVAGGLIAAVISASGPHELLSAEALADRVLAELAARVPGLPKPVWQKVVNEKFATFACTPGANRPGAATSYPGVFLAGDYVAGDYPATLEGAVRNGIAAAQATLDYLRTITSIP